LKQRSQRDSMSPVYSQRTVHPVRTETIQTAIQPPVLGSHREVRFQQFIHGTIHEPLPVQWCSESHCSNQSNYLPPATATLSPNSRVRALPASVVAKTHPACPS
jgi:hypothetical protein